MISTVRLKEIMTILGTCLVGSLVIIILIITTLLIIPGPPIKLIKVQDFPSGTVYQSQGRLIFIPGSNNDR